MNNTDDAAQVPEEEPLSTKDFGLSEEEASPKEEGSDLETQAPEQQEDAGEGEDQTSAPPQAPTAPLPHPEVEEWRALLSSKLKDGTQIILGRCHVISWCFLDALAAVVRDKRLKGVALHGGVLRKETLVAAQSCTSAGPGLHPSFLNGVIRTHGDPVPWLVRLLKRDRLQIRPSSMPQDQVVPFFSRPMEGRSLLVVARTTGLRDSFSSFGIDCDHIRDLALMARSGPDMDLLVSTMSGMPWTQGIPECPNGIEKDEARMTEGWFEEKQGSLPDWRAPLLPASDQALVDRAAELVLSNAQKPLHIDLGTVSMALCEKLAGSEWSGLGVGTLLHPGHKKLMDAGKLTGSRISLSGQPRILEGQLAGSCAVGDTEFYRWMDGNDRMVLLPDSQVMRSDFFAGALAVEEMPGLDFDLQIPCEDCESMGARGPGATQAILDGVAASEEGVFVGCLRDVTVDKWGRALSCLAPYQAWNAVTRASLARLLPLATGKIYLVTNHGTAQIAGMSLEQAVKAMISIAPPDLKKILSRVAWKKLGVA